MRMPDEVKVGTRLRGIAPPGHRRPLAHVRALFDGLAAIRVWRSGRWRYEVIGPEAFIVGLWEVE